MGGQVMIQMGVHSACNMFFLELSSPCVGVGEIEAAIHDAAGNTR
jgi:hypothetical protein